MAIDQYWKAVIALVASVAAAIAAGVGAGDIGDLSTQDWIGIILVILGGTAITWFAENITGLAGGIIKAVLAASTAGLTALATGYGTDGAISQGELLVAISAFLVALAVTYQVPGPTPPTAAVVPTTEVGATAGGVATTRVTR